MATQIPVTLDDLAHIAELSDPRHRPGHAEAVLVKRMPNYGDNRFDATLVLVDLATGESRELTYERSDARHPRWSPDGAKLAFIASDSNEVGQVFVLEMNGGDARPITDAQATVLAFCWDPAGERIAYVAEAVDDSIDRDTHNVSFVVGDNAYLAQAASQPRLIWVTSPDGAQPRRYDLGGGSVAHFRQKFLSFHPDGQSIAFCRQTEPHSGAATREFEIHSLNLATGVHEQLVQGMEPEYSAGGDLLYSLPTDELAFSPDTVNVLTPRGDTIRLGASIDRGLSATWLDASSVIAHGYDGVSVGAWRLGTDGSASRFDWGDLEPAEFSVGDRGRIVCVGATPDRPPELYATGRASSPPARLTMFNATVERRQLGHPARMTWHSDHFELDGVLNYPADFDPGQKYPLVLIIHGGPMGTSTLGFSAAGKVLMHAMTAKGWLVFNPNYRGSGNLGRAVQRSVIDDAGDGPGRDVMAGLSALKARGFVDEKRVAVTGWSYGGFMTAWLTAHYDGWRAAVAGAPVTDWYDWYNLADMNTWAGLGLRGSPWLNDNAGNYWRQSPMAYAHRIRTPTLILSNTRDPRVTVTQSYKLYHALKDNGVPVEFVAYPIEGHFPQDPVHTRDVYQRWLSWIDTAFQSAS